MDEHITPSPRSCPRCAVAPPHDHGPCQVCCFYTLTRPGAGHGVRRPTCLHPTMREDHVDRQGAYTVWGDVTVRNGMQTCPTFRRDPRRTPHGRMGG